MTRYANADELEAWNRRSEAARAEFDAAQEAGLAWMRAHNYQLPPDEMYDRMMQAHDAWKETLREMPALFGKPAR